MMSVMGAVGGVASAVSAVGNAISNTKKAAKKELDQSDFLNLLTTQLTMQDPTKPYDSSSMLQQMANLTSLNSNQTLQKTVQSLQTSFGNTQLIQASMLVGREVQIESQTGLLSSEGLKGSVSLPAAAQDVTVSIKDASGKIVKTMNLGSSNPGSIDFKWNGIGDDGTALPQGTYSISAIGNIQGQQTSLPTAASFKVESVNLPSSGKPLQLNIQNRGAIELTQILKVL